MIIKHGIDITSLNRIEFKNKKLPQKLLHKNELVTFLLIKEELLQIKFLAGIWSLKEAIYKCFEGEITSLKALNIEKTLTNKPFCFFNNIYIDLSLSYENEYVFASAIRILND